MFFVSVFGVTSSEDYTIMKVTQDSTTQEVITQALQKAGKPNEKPEDYVLVEEVHKGWDKKDRETGSQRILELTEKVLLAQNKWKGSGKFVLKKKCDDPSTRAWMTTMVKEQQRRAAAACTSTSDLTPEWDRGDDVFLVCIHNVSPDQPYTIIQAPTASTAQDIIAQALLKARRTENPASLVLVEEVVRASVSAVHATGIGGGESVPGGRARTTAKVDRHVLDDDDNVYQVQHGWKSNAGKFVLTDRAAATKVKNKRKHSTRWSFMKFSSLSRERKDKATALPDGPAPRFRRSAAAPQQPRVAPHKPPAVHYHRRPPPRHRPTLRRLEENVVTMATQQHTNNIEARKIPNGSPSRRQPPHHQH